MNSSFRDEYRVTPWFCKSTLDKVNDTVEKNFYKPSQLPSWREELAKRRVEIEKSKNIIELDQRINGLIATLNTSHCQFLTKNDEAYYFLQSLFAKLAQEEQRPSQNAAAKIDFVGAITGGGNCKENEIRYVLDGSPAASAGLRIGDQIATVDGQQYLGQLSYIGKSGKNVEIEVARYDSPDQGVKPKMLKVSLVPKSVPNVQGYTEGIRNSVKIDPQSAIGYIHLWTGSGDTHEVLEELLSGKLQQTKGLIFDMRDGYGGAFFNDLDMFFRPAKAYPEFSVIDRKGHKRTNHLYYDKPIVALINGGSRSGKELLSYAFKRSGRAKLVGERTAGMVVAGRLFKVNNRASLYLAVQDAEVNGETLEGHGVQPDIEILESAKQRGIRDLQLEEAKRILLTQQQTNAAQ